MREIIDQVMRSEITTYSGANGATPFAELGVDSFGLVDLRAAIETATGRNIPDPIWVRLGSPADILDSVGGAIAPAAGGAFRRTRATAINMPQMAFSGLSESWLFKEVGDLHWSMITEGLGVPSSEMFDGNGDRLYATFTRIQIKMRPLRSYKENEDFALTAEMTRFGGGIFMARMGGDEISVETMSSFAKRSEAGSNKDLAKGQPTIPDGCPIPAVLEKPVFVSGYGEARRMDFAARPSLFSVEHEINPYHDINGVGLVYFAAYPLIADTCELQRPGGRGRAAETSTTERDIFYFSNANPDDTLRYNLLAENDLGPTIKTEALISNATTGAPMALVKTVKAKHA